MEQQISREEAIEMLDVAAMQLVNSLYEMRQKYIDKALKTLKPEDLIGALRMEQTFMTVTIESEEKIQARLVGIMKTTLKELGTNPDGEAALSFITDYNNLLKLKRQ